MTTAGEPISTSRTRHPDVEPGVSAMARPAASLQCRTGAVACMAGSAPALALTRASNAPAGLTGSTATSQQRRRWHGTRVASSSKRCASLSRWGITDVLRVGSMNPKPTSPESRAHQIKHRLCDVGGSPSKEFNHVLIKQVVGSLWTPCCRERHLAPGSHALEGPVHEMRAPRRSERPSEIEVVGGASAPDRAAAPPDVLDAVHAGGGRCIRAGGVCRGSCELRPPR
jgi:hypothetical protein